MIKLPIKGTKNGIRKIYIYEKIFDGIFVCKSGGVLWSWQFCYKFYLCPGVNGYFS
jgi:hypothetical protein